MRIPFDDQGNAINATHNFIRWPDEVKKKVKVWDWVFYDKDCKDYNCIVKQGWTEEQVLKYVANLRENKDMGYMLQRKIEGTEREEMR